ncbi:MAG TPA: hypothetical protein VFD49_25860 [Candidatus Dormibacteraeota bacterium]|nr:hypothetical protein [Candidatus Dormibacteraeota bacterium]
MATGESPRPVAKLEHDVPGRVRVRLGREHRSPERMGPLERRLARHPAVGGVETNPRTGSILVTGAAGAPLREALEEFFELVQEEGPERLPEVGVQVAVDLVKRVDGQLAHVTGGRLSLRWLVPAVFVTFGVRQLLAQGLTVGAVPWYVLVYYGIDSFLKLYPEYAPGPGRGRSRTSGRVSLAGG